MSKLTLTPGPSVYQAQQTMNITPKDDVKRITYTDDGISPTLSKYIAYDDLIPPNPFLAAVEDGRGRVLFDGGFPKWYNRHSKDAWTSFGDMNGQCKYLANAISYLANPEKVAAGNRKILFLGDTISGENYNLRDGSSSDFDQTIETVCSIMGWEPTIRDRSNFSVDALDLDHSFLNQFCCVIYFASKKASSVPRVTGFEEELHGQFPNTVRIHHAFKEGDYAYAYDEHYNRLYHSSLNDLSNWTVVSETQLVDIQGYHVHDGRHYLHGYNSSIDEYQVISIDLTTGGITTLFSDIIAHVGYWHSMAGTGQYLCFYPDGSGGTLYTYDLNNNTWSNTTPTINHNADLDDIRGYIENSGNFHIYKDNDRYGYSVTYNIWYNWPNQFTNTVVDGFTTLFLVDATITVGEINGNPGMRVKTRTADFQDYEELIFQAGYNLIQKQSALIEHDGHLYQIGGASYSRDIVKFTPILQHPPEHTYKFMTDACISNLVNYRENGNGIFVITDHGNDIADIGSDIPSHGFIVTANYLVKNFGAWFSGNYNRKSVSVGYLRANYGDHPLWANLTDDEKIYAGESESRVFIKEYTYYEANNLPTLSLTEDGYTTYKFLIELIDGTLLNESYTYGLSTAELVRFKNNVSQIITEINTVFNNTDIYFDLIPGALGELSGLIKHNNMVIGEVIHDGIDQTINWYKNKNNIPLHKNDTFVIQITSPLEYIKPIILNRLQPPVTDELSLSRFINKINHYEWFQSGVLTEQYLINALNVIQQPISQDTSLNVKLLKQYINDELELPEQEGLIYETTNTTNSKLINYVPPTMSEVFSIWGVFGIVDTDPELYDGYKDEYYPTIAQAPAADPYDTWELIDNSYILQSANTNYYTGFVSMEKVEYYTHEATFSSGSNPDDDLISLVVAHKYDEANSKNIVLSLGISNGGALNGSLMVFFDGIGYDSGGFSGTSQSTFYASSDHDITYLNPDLDGWRDKKIRVKVTRKGNLVEALATNWNDPDNYNPASKLTVDLSEHADLIPLLGPQSYGYGTRSQTNATYEDIVFQGGLDRSIIINFETRVVYMYKDNQWMNSGLSIQEVYGYPRKVTNPETNKTYLVTKNDVVLLN